MVWTPAVYLPIQLPANVPGKMAEDDPFPVYRRTEWTSGILASAWPGPSHWDHLGSKLVDGSSVSPFLCNSAFLINTYIKYTHTHTFILSENISVWICTLAFASYNLCFSSCMFSLVWEPCSCLPSVSYHEGCCSVFVPGFTSVSFLIASFLIRCLWICVAPIWMTFPVFGSKLLSGFSYCLLLFSSMISYLHSMNFCLLDQGASGVFYFLFLAVFN